MMRRLVQLAIFSYVLAVESVFGSTLAYVGTFNCLIEGCITEGDDGMKMEN